MLGGFLGCFVHAHCKAGSPSTLLSHNVSVPVRVLHHHPCTSQCPQHHAAPACAQLQPCRERSGDGVNVPNSFSAHKQHKGERGRREGGRKGISLFSILNSSLLECGCAAIPPAWEGRVVIAQPKASSCLSWVLLLLLELTSQAVQPHDAL